MTPPIERRPRWLEALGVIAAALVVVGVALPWFSTEVGDPSQASLLGRITALTATGVTLALTDRRPRWSWVALGLAVVAGALTIAAARPGRVCWDHYTPDGSYSGGACHPETYTPAFLIFGAGLALLVLFRVLDARYRRLRRDVASCPRT